MQFTLVWIGVWSAFKVGWMLSTIFALFAGLPLFFFQALIIDIVTRITSARPNAPDSLVLWLCGWYLVGVVIAGFIGGIGYGFFALVYNISSSATGGLVLFLSKDALEIKRDPVVPRYADHDLEYLSRMASYTSEGRNKAAIQREIEQKRKEIEGLYRDLRQ